MIEEKQKMHAVEAKMALLKRRGFKDSFPATSDDDRQLEARFKRGAAGSDIPYNVTFEFTNDPAMIARYIELREKIYAKELYDDEIELSELRGNGLVGPRDDFDGLSDILIVRAGNNVVGGARLTVSSPSNPCTLPMEFDGFRIKDCLAGIDSQRSIYAEFSRFIMLPGFRSPLHSREVFRKIDQRARHLGVQYIFAATPMIQAIAYRRIYRSLGRRLIICEDILYPKNPIHGGVHMHFLMTKTAWPKINEKMSNLQSKDIELSNQELSGAIKSPEEV